jgi:LL-diaminopimelate aminotransferase
VQKPVDCGAMRRPTNPGPLGNPVATTMASYPMRELADAAVRLREAGHVVFDFTIGDPLEATPDFIRRALIEAVPEVSQYPTARGQAGLRQAAAGWARRRFGVELDPEREILPTAGSKEGIFHLPLVVLDSSSERRGVVLGEPGYPVYERGAALAGGDPMTVPLTAENGFVLEPWLLSSEAAERAAIVWINYPHNPTGAAATADDLGRILEWCRERSVLLCSDECYVDVYYDGEERPPSLLEVTGGDRRGILCFFSCSKRSGMTGYRSGFMAGDADLLATYGKMRETIGTASPDFVQHAAIAAWSDDRHAAHRRSVFSAKREVFRQLFNDLGIEVAGSQAAFYLWVRTPEGMSSEAYCKHLLEASILVAPGGSFGPSGEGYVRLALVPSKEQCEMAAEAWRKLEEAGA